MSWSSVALSTLVDIKGGGTPSKANPEYWNGSIPWASVKDFKSSDLNSASDYITQEGIDNSATSLIPSGNLIVPTRMALGKVAINSVDIAINQDLKALIIKDESVVDTEYLFRCIQSKSEEIVRQGKGATVKGITVDVLKNLQIPLPPLETQKQIATVLEKSDQLRKDCQQMEQELSNLAQSVFIDMFGDPVTNPKGWEMKALSELASIVTGNTPSRAKPEYYGSDIEWIKSGNINTPLDYLTVAEEYLSEDGKKAGRVVQSGSVLMTCIAGSPDCIGNIAIADREVAFNQQINALVPMDKKLDTEFLYVLLKVAKKIIQSASTNSMKGMISKSKLESIQLPFPSYAEQCDFSTIYKKLQKEVKKQNEQVVETELMFDALMQKAFKGELNL
ncbi:restriction endonuclease subunit S [Vibrio methylphosphonaticus]|uniref:restriction endonuclease subunit S n=1 Tax=Vibrio methylphosphonaticus TaxID=2946866 RepID=UPI00202A7DA9|nr:restriction endonuclease subunit S [Vibrio methylphosphonaticus]MCL9775378.1 restriction endonuclease subunit S [Vibrio methylphosphonaticus]